MYNKTDLVFPCIFCTNPPIIGPHNRARHRKADPISPVLLRPGSIPTVKPVKQLIRRHVRKALTAILNPHLDQACLSGKAHLYFPIFICILYRIIQKKNNQPFDLPPDPQI